jgi:hypothetical protein
LLQPSASRRIDCSRLWMITGLNTFNCKCPWLAAKADGDVVAQHLAGQHRQRFALGRVDLAGHDRAARFVGRQFDSASPARGPEPSRRRSLAIFISATARVFSAPDRWSAARGRPARRICSAR